MVKSSCGYRAALLATTVIAGSLGAAKAGPVKPRKRAHRMAVKRRLRSTAGSDLLARRGSARRLIRRSPSPRERFHRLRTGACSASALPRSAWSATVNAASRVLCPIDCWFDGAVQAALSLNGDRKKSFLEKSMEPAPCGLQRCWSRLRRVSVPGRPGFHAGRGSRGRRSKLCSHGRVKRPDRLSFSPLAERRVQISSAGVALRPPPVAKNFTGVRLPPKQLRLRNPRVADFS